MARQSIKISRCFTAIGPTCSLLPRFIFSFFFPLLFCTRACSRLPPQCAAKLRLAILAISRAAIHRNYRLNGFHWRKAIELSRGVLRSVALQEIIVLRGTVFSRERIRSCVGGRNTTSSTISLSSTSLPHLSSYRRLYSFN